MKLIVAVALSLVSLGAYAQEFEMEEGVVEVFADQRINRLIDRRAEFHRVDSTISGFRIQIFSTTERQDVNLAKDKFTYDYPELPIYMKYDSPNFKLRVGNFESKLDA